MVFIKWSEKVGGSGDNIDSPLCGGVYKGEYDYLVPLTGTESYANMNGFTWSKYNNDRIIPGDQYNE